MSMMGAEQVLCDNAVEAMIAAKAADLEAINTGLSQRVYEGVAPDGTPYPFVIYQCLTPPRDIRGVGTFRQMVDTLYLVKAVAQGSSYAPLAPVARVLDAAMTAPEGVVVDGGAVFTSVREQQHSRVTVEQGTQFRHFGGEYKMQAQAAQ